MAVAYPTGLRPMISASKTRTQPAGFRLIAPRRGTPFAEENGTASPVFYDCLFRFTQPEAVIFQGWFNGDLARGALEAEIPIRTEFGVVATVGLFLPDPPMSVSESGGLWDYRCTFMGRSLYLPP